MTRLGVAVFVGSYLPYSETFIYDQLRLHQRYRAEVYANSRLPGAANRFPFETIHALDKLHTIVYQVFGSASRFDAALSRQRPAVVHAHFGTNGVYALPFARRCNAPLAVTFHGHDVPALVGRRRFSARYGRYALFAKRMFAQAAALLPASRDLADRLIGQVGAPAHKIEVLPLGVDLSRFPQNSVRDERPTALMVGRFVEKKGHVYGMRAFARVLEQLPDARLVLIGNGPLLQQYRREIRRLGIGGATTLTGVLFPADVATWVARAHVLICPSITAGSGDIESGVMVIKEAAAASTPTIGTRHGGIPEIIDHEQTGFLVAERDVCRTAQYLQLVLSDSKTQSDLGAAAQRKARRCFDISRQIELLEGVFDRTLGA
jgi:colanic acid/amylovoran biosynthesis glycosyltransferase